MKAAVYRQNNKNLLIENLPVPEIKQDEVLIKVAACGLCHTDLHYIDHGVPTFREPPIILGHEASGIIEEAGEKAFINLNANEKIKNEKQFKKGYRVLVPAVLSCGTCKFCKQGRENTCQSMIMPGNSINGAFSQYMAVPSKDIILLPDEIPLEEACIIADAVSTPYHAVINKAKVKPSDTVIVFGCGGVGINVVQIAAFIGAKVIAYDIENNKLQAAKEFGAEIIINPRETNLKEFLKKNKIRADIVFEVIGNSEVIELAYSILGIGGKLCIIGYTNQNITINPAKIMFFEQEIIGSVGCPPSKYLEIIDLVKNNKLKLDKLIANKYELEEINKALDELRKSKVLRNIILPNGKNFVL